MLNGKPYVLVFLSQHYNIGVVQKIVKSQEQLITQKLKIYFKVRLNEHRKFAKLSIFSGTRERFKKY